MGVSGLGLRVAVLGACGSDAKFLGNWRGENSPSAKVSQLP